MDTPAGQVSARSARLLNIEVSLRCLSNIRPGDRVVIRDIDHIEGRVLTVDREGLQVDWSQRFGRMRHAWDEVGSRLVRFCRAGQRVGWIGGVSGLTGGLWIKITEPCGTEPEPILTRSGRLL